MRNHLATKFYAASLNYRDIAISREYPLGHYGGIVSGSDGSGLVVSIGSLITSFKVGDKVLTTYNQAHLSGSLTLATVKNGTGGRSDGALAEYVVFNETGLVAMPKSPTWEEAATLLVASVTAWNALYGLEGRRLKVWDFVLTQGTRGTSIIALLLAVAAGATVIATTSSKRKAVKLKALGATHVINYKSDSNWGDTVRLIIRGTGVDHVIEVGGPTSMAQSLKAIKIDRVINLIGFLGGFKDPNEPSYFQTLFSLCTVRGLLCGSKVQFEELNCVIDNRGIKPAYDDKVFTLRETKEAYRFLADQKHFAKVVIKIAE
ncbi:Zinc-type alcohol dehydrogenase-like protein [Cladobotryum mycophilum]|uniref:Zinc-type alcohol dehydrogenase-like protein n=1 Tax=Cladobotryum mycophilum TaxID=491253 RepID=A0ABR0SQP1_9HYPO